MTYRHLGAEECATRYKRATKLAYASMIITALVTVLLVFLRVYWGLIPPIAVLLPMLALTAVTCILVNRAVGSDDYVELSARGYALAGEIAERCPAAAMRLRVWTEQSGFLALRDLLELERLDDDRRKGLPERA